ncbi:hypothetical protein Ancab_028143 [Ancistrocladus abbreviatus]
MISSKSLIKFAKKWQKLAALRQKRIEWPKSITNKNEDPCSTSSRAEKGHFVLYTADERRFMISLEYLKNDMLRKLLEAAEEEFGLPKDGPVTVPCDAAFMEYALFLIKHHAAKDLQKAFLMSSKSAYLILESSMISPKTLIKLAKKWQNLAAYRRKRISWPRSTTTMDEDPCSTSSRVEKGQFVLYSAEKRRFMIPLEYLKNDMLRELLEAAEEEFGLPKDGPITLPCDTAFMEYALSLIQGPATKDLQKALLMTITTGHCLSSSMAVKEQRSRYQTPICSF